MARKPTIYKARIALSDLVRHHYDSLRLTVAQHPSESVERMMARVLVFCMNAREGLVFTRGLSSTDEPDIWARTADDRVALWIEVGEPSVERVKKATRLAPQVRVYSFNTKSDHWWAESQGKLATLNVEVFQLRWSKIQALAALADRTMEMSVTISEDSVYVATEKGECELEVTRLSGV